MKVHRGWLYLSYFLAAFVIFAVFTTSHVTTRINHDWQQAALPVVQAAGYSEVKTPADLSRIIATGPSSRAMYYGAPVKYELRFIRVEK